MIVLTSYLRFTVKKRGLAKNNWMELSWEHPYERKTHSLREVLKREEKQTAAVDLFPFGGHAVHKAGELQRMMNLPCLAELPVVVQKVRKNIRPLPRSGIEASARGFQNMETRCNCAPQKRWRIWAVRRFWRQTLCQAKENPL